MKASKFSEAQTAFILKQGADGVPVAEICRNVNTRRSETRSRCGCKSMISSSKSSQCQDPDRRRLKHSPLKHFLRYIRDLRDLLDGVKLRRVFTGSKTVRRWPQGSDELVAVASGRP